MIKKLLWIAFIIKRYSCNILRYSRHAGQSFLPISSNYFPGFVNESQAFGVDTLMSNDSDPVKVVLYTFLCNR